VAKRKKAKRKTKRISFKRSTAKKRKKRKKRKSRRPMLSLRTTLIIIAAVLAVICVLLVGRIGFDFLHKYVKETVAVNERVGSIELVDVPAWVSRRLEEKVYTAAGGGEDLKLDEDAARSIQNNLVREVAWLDEVKVQITHESIRIKALWRKPVALVKQGSRRFYVDAELVVLDPVPIEALPIVQVRDLSPGSHAPSVGEVWQQDDLAAAVVILELLDRMDKRVTPDKPLLYEIDAIDVSNFDGRENSRLPHIVLYAKDNTEIVWGAEYDKWQRHFEATDEEKLAKLYSYYQDYGTLLNSAKSINLREPQDTPPLPIDKR
jgi:hypothetical protein